MPNDHVPVSGPWQTDPELRRLVSALNAIRAKSGGNMARGSAGAADPDYQRTALALSRYVEANRGRLGIPANYWPDLRTNGQTLYDPNQNVWRNAGLAGGALAGGGYALGGLLGGPAAAAGGGVPVSGAGAGEIAASSGPLGAGGVTAGPVATAAGTGTAGTIGTSMASRGAQEAAGGVGGFLKNLATPENAAGLAALIAGLTGGQDFDQQSAETKRINAINEARMRRVDPLHQVATKLAFGRLPTNYRQGVNLTDVPLPE